MTRDSFADDLLEAVNQIAMTPQVFNPYVQTETGLDVLGAPKIREYNLRTYVDSVERGGALVVGEAPGFKGARFSGVPLTSERQLVEQRIPCFGMQTSREERPRAEATATMVWNAIKPYRSKTFLWNAFPLHPHGPDGMANRVPTNEEMEDGRHALQVVMEHFEPIRVLALGKRAHEQLDEMRIEHVTCPHPSYSGKRGFEAAVDDHIKAMFDKWDWSTER